MHVDETLIRLTALSVTGVVGSCIAGYVTPGLTPVVYSKEHIPRNDKRISSTKTDPA